MATSRPHPVLHASTSDAPTFASLGVPQEFCDSLTAQGIETAFPVQALTLPDALAGRDVLGQGRTGSGKTLAFVLPILTRLSDVESPRGPRRPRALILAPTRELARQIADVVQRLGREVGLFSATVVGGLAPGPQIAALKRGVDIVVATPGRLEDHLRAGHVRLDGIEVTVLDEADHMADLGFMPAVTRLLGLTPSNSQRLFFSATLDDAVSSLVKRFLHEPVVHRVVEDEAPADVEHHVLHIDQAHRLGVLVELTSAPGRSMVFTRTKHRASQLTRQLVAAGVPAIEMHGNLTQARRTRNLAAFSQGRATTLVATDIAARGIHVDDVRLVIHADPPVEHKTYLHRSGRTARAGASGTVVTLATKDQQRAVRRLSKMANVEATYTALAPGHELLSQLAPGERELLDPAQIERALSDQAVGAKTAPRAGTRPGTRDASRAKARPNSYGARPRRAASDGRDSWSGTGPSAQRTHQRLDESRAPSREAAASRSRDGVSRGAPRSSQPRSSQPRSESRGGWSR